MPTFSHRTNDVAYTDEGTGTPIVFIHGYPFNRHSWDAQVAGLSGTARCIAIDLPGHGDSSGYYWSHSVDSYAETVAALLDHLAIERAVICGLSMGGYVTLAFWRNHASRVLALVLADTRAQPDSDEAKAGRFNAALTAQRDGVEGIIEGLVPRVLSENYIKSRPDRVEELKAIMRSTSPQGYVGDLMAMAGRPDSTSDLGSIDVPVLVIVGEADVLTPVADSELMAKAIPAASLKTVPGAGHVSNFEDPDAFNAALKEFLARL